MTAAAAAVGVRSPFTVSVFLAIPVGRRIELVTTSGTFDLGYRETARVLSQVLGLNVSSSTIMLRAQSRIIRISRHPILKGAFPLSSPPTRLNLGRVSRASGGIELVVSNAASVHVGLVDFQAWILGDAGDRWRRVGEETSASDSNH